MPEPVGEKAERVLILCVDRDDDLGRKTGRKTPILGRKENLNAATELALQDPEEADANAMFEAIRIYDRLKQRTGTPEEHEIATIGGSELGGVEADRKLVSELTGVLEAFPASGVILVTDGFADEALRPLVESRVPVTSVKRIVVKHSESIEESITLFFRYLKMLVENPRYSKPLLGLPGILVIALVLLWLYGQLFYAGVAILLIVGSFLFVKGFGFDKKVLGFYNWIRSYSPPPLERQVIGFSTVAGALLIGVGCYRAAASIYTGAVEWMSIVQRVLGVYPPIDFSQWLALLPYLIGYFISQSITLIVIGVCVLLSGGAVRWFLVHDPRFLRTLVVMAVTAWSRQILYEASKILIDPKTPSQNLVFAIAVGILLATVASLTAFLSHRKYTHFFREKEGKVEEPKEG